MKTSTFPSGAGVTNFRRLGSQLCSEEKSLLPITARDFFCTQGREPSGCRGTAARYCRKSSTEAQRVELFGIIGSTVSQAQIDRVSAFATTAGNGSAERAAALKALITAQQQRQLKPRNAPSLVALLGENDKVVALAATELAGWWKLEEARTSLETLARALAHSPAPLNSASPAWAARLHKRSWNSFSPLGKNHRHRPTSSSH